MQIFSNSLEDRTISYSFTAILAYSLYGLALLFVRIASVLSVLDFTDTAKFSFNNYSLKGPIEPSVQLYTTPRFVKEQRLLYLILVILYSLEHTGCVELAKVITTIELYLYKYRLIFDSIFSNHHTITSTSNYRYKEYG